MSTTHVNPGAFSRSSSQQHHHHNGGSIALADINQLKLPSMEDYFSNTSNDENSKHRSLPRQQHVSPIKNMPEFVPGYSPSKKQQLDNSAAKEQEALPFQLPALAQLQQQQQHEEEQKSSASTRFASREPLLHTSSHATMNGATASSSSSSLLPPFIPPSASKQQATTTVTPSPQPSMPNPHESGNSSGVVVDESFLEQHLKAVQDYYEGRLQEMETELVKARSASRNGPDFQQPPAFSYSASPAPQQQQHQQQASRDDFVYSFQQPENQRIYSASSSSNSRGLAQHQDIPRRNSTAASRSHTTLESEEFSLHDLDSMTSGSLFPSQHQQRLFPKTTNASSDLTPLMSAFMRRQSEQQQHQQDTSRSGSSTYSSGGTYKINIFGGNKQQQSESNNNYSNSRSSSAGYVTTSGGVLADRRGGVVSPARLRADQQQSAAAPVHHRFRGESIESVGSAGADSFWAGDSQPRTMDEYDYHLQQQQKQQHQPLPSRVVYPATGARRENHGGDNSGILAAPIRPTGSRSVSADRDRSSMQQQMYPQQQQHYQQRAAPSTMVGVHLPHHNDTIQQQQPSSQNQSVVSQSDGYDSSRSGGLHAVERPLNGTPVASRAAWNRGPSVSAAAAVAPPAVQSEMDISRFVEEFL